MEIKYVMIYDITFKVTSASSDNYQRYGIK